MEETIPEGLTPPPLVRQTGYYKIEAPTHDCAFCGAWFYCSVICNKAKICKCKAVKTWDDQGVFTYHYCCDTFCFNYFQKVN